MEDTQVHLAIPPHFQHICSLPTPLPNCTLTEYFSRYSGVRVFLIDVESPLVHGVFFLPTEPHDNAGLPHTLEHLIFLGSQDYPVKGLLDCLASRCLANGTNAWTATDHTAYTVSTAGTEGFYTLLPVYLDHIMRPTLDDDAFLTEVHHLSEDGKSSGVVFSEMQSRENTAESLQFLEALKYLYPGDSGYSYESGGLMKDIRNATNQQIHRFHKQFYRWSNLNLIISGKVDATHLLNIISSVEEHQIGAESLEASFSYDALFGPNAGSTRPWQSEMNAAPLKESVCSTIRFPVDEEKAGSVCVSWRGPKWSNFNDTHSLNILGEYLTVSNLSPLQKKLVEIDDPICADVDFNLENWKETHFEIECTDVLYHPTDVSSNKIVVAAAAVHAALSDVLEEGIDMQRMHNIIKRESLTFLLSLESDPLATLGASIIEYCVNGDTVDQLRQYMELPDLYRALLEKEEMYWLNLLKAYFIAAPNVEVQSVPSTARRLEIEASEKEFQALQIALHGEEQLREMGEKMERIKQKQNARISDELLESFPFASVNEVRMIEPCVYRNFGDLAVQNADWRDVITERLPFPLQLNTLPTNFAYITAFLSIPDTLTPKEMRLLPLLSDLIFESDVILNGNAVTHKAFTLLLLQHTVSYSTSYCGNRNFPYSMRIEMISHLSNFTSAMDLLIGVLFNLQLSAKRAKIHLKSHLSTLQKSKRKPKVLLDTMETFTRYKEDSCVNCYNLPALENCLLQLKSSIETCVTELRGIYEKVFRIENLRIHVSTDLKRLPSNWIASFQKIANLNKSVMPLSEHLPHDSVTLRSIAFDCVPLDSSLQLGNAIVCASGSTDASYMKFKVKSACGYDHKDLPLLIVLCELFSQLEGPLYRLVRGGGFAYGCSLLHQPIVGDLCLSIYPSVNIVQAFQKCIACFKDYLEEKITFSAQEIESAKSTAFYSIIEKERNSVELSNETFVNAFKNLSIDANSQLIAKVSTVTSSDVSRAIQVYLRPFVTFNFSKLSFKDGKSLMIVANSHEAKAISDSLLQQPSNSINLITSKALYQTISPELYANSRKITNKKLDGVCGAASNLNGENSVEYTYSEETVNDEKDSDDKDEDEDEDDDENEDDDDDEEEDEDDEDDDEDYKDERDDDAKVA